MKQRLLPLVLVACLLMVGACTGDDEPNAKGGDEPSPTETGDASSPPTGPSDPTSPTSTVEPASGVRLELSAVSANAPEGWKKDGVATDYQVSANHPQLVTSITLFEVPDPGDGVGGVQLSARQSIYAASWLRKPKILEPTEIDGTEVYHVAGRVDSASFIEEWGATVDGQAVRIRVHMTEIMSSKERRELVESVLPTVQFSD